MEPGITPPAGRLQTRVLVDELAKAVRDSRLEYERLREKHLAQLSTAVTTGLDTMEGRLAMSQANATGIEELRAFTRYEEAVRRFAKLLLE